MIGQRVAHYQIVAKLGEGGMGVVYKARDTHLNRSVALKVLPAEAVADEARMRRFVQEAKSASTLNHPGVVTVYDIGEHDGVHFIAMELVPGNTLLNTIGHKGFPLRDTLRYAIQIADALACAHEAGIVHRDLKPTNVMVDERGQIRVLDFGLAKLAEREPLGDETRTMSPKTQEGQIVGTFAYMSPEQAQSKPVDARSDIFSFGSVLYEMATGQRAFSGEDGLSTLSAILRGEPEPVSRLAAETPRELERIIHRCLRKDPEDRFQHMADVKVLLREIQEESGISRAAEARNPGTHRKMTLALAGTAAIFLLGGAALGTWLSGRRPGDAAVPLRKFHLEVSGGARGMGMEESYARPAIAPNGAMLAYTLNDQLWVRDLHGLKPRAIADTQGAERPFWSPDSQFVAFAAKAVLKKVPAQGGPSSTLCELPPGGQFLGGTWGSAGSLAIAINNRGLFELPAQGGEPKPLLMADHSKGEVDFHSPHYLPDGRTLLFHVHPDTGYQWRLATLSGQTVRRVLGESSGNVAHPVYTASGHLIYQKIRGVSTIYAVPFSASSLAPTGEAFAIAEDGTAPSVSQEGTLVYEVARPSEMVMVDRSGRFERAVAAQYEQTRFPAFSPDGGRVAFMGVQEGNFDIWVHDLVRGGRTRLTADPVVDSTPDWSPSGEYLAYSSGTSGKTAIFRMRSDGSGERQPLASVDTSATSPKWSPDGKSLVYVVTGTKGNNGIWYLSPTGSGQPQPFLTASFAVLNPDISPDGRFIAYASNESGRNEVYVRPFPKGEGSWPVSVNGGTLPRWNRRGHELFYVEDNALMAVPVETRSGFRAGTPHQLFDGDKASVAVFVQPEHLQL